MSDLAQWAEADVLSLGMAADEERRARRGTNVVTYARVHVVRPEELSARVPAPEGGAELRLYETPDTLSDAVAQVEALAAAANGRRVVAFSMAALEARSWGALAEVLARLVAAGLQDVAELPVDRVADVGRSIAALQRAGVTPQRLTVAEPVGDKRLTVIARAEQAMAQHSTLCRFAPLPRTAPADKPTTGYEDVRMVALARLALGAASIEVDWRLYGPKLAQVALTFGADHLDAVPVTSDPALGPRRSSVEDVERNIRAAGFEPLELRPAAPGRALDIGGLGDW